MIEYNSRIERSRFADYIFQTWEIDKHNFSRHPEGHYVYTTMQLAWEAWSTAKEECINDINNLLRKKAAAKLAGKLKAVENV